MVNLIKILYTHWPPVHLPLNNDHFAPSNFHCVFILQIEIIWFTTFLEFQYFSICVIYFSLRLYARIWILMLLTIFSNTLINYFQKWNYLVTTVVFFSTRFWLVLKTFWWYVTLGLAPELLSDIVILKTSLTTVQIL